MGLGPGYRSRHMGCLKTHQLIEGMHHEIHVNIDINCKPKASLTHNCMPQSFSVIIQIYFTYDIFLFSRSSVTILTKSVQK